MHLFALAARYIGLFLLSSFLRFTHARAHASIERHIGTRRNRSCVIPPFFYLMPFLGIRKKTKKTKTNSRHTENRLPSKNAGSILRNVNGISDARLSDKMRLIVFSNYSKYATSTINKILLTTQRNGTKIEKKVNVLIDKLYHLERSYSDSISWGNNKSSTQG